MNPFTEEEENTLFEAHKLYKNKWVEISKVLPGRTDNAVKNYYYAAMRKEIRRINRVLKKQKKRGKKKEKCLGKISFKNLTDILEDENIHLKELKTYSIDQILNKISTRTQRRNLSFDETHFHHFLPQESQIKTEEIQFALDSPMNQYRTETIENQEFEQKKKKIGQKNSQKMEYNELMQHEPIRNSLQMPLFSNQINNVPPIVQNPSPVYRNLFIQPPLQYNISGFSPLNSMNQMGYSFMNPNLSSFSQLFSIQKSAEYRTYL